MNDKITAREFRESLDRRLSGVRIDPFLASRILASEEGAKSVRKKLPLSIVIAIALVIVAAVAALAAGSIMGWRAFDEYFHDVPLSDSAWEALESTEPVRQDLGDITFTVRELYFNGTMALASTKVEMKDGSRALFVAPGDQPDFLGSNGENGTALAESLGLDPMTHWTDAAKQLGIPLYTAEAEFRDIGEMYDTLYDEDGNMVFYSQGSCTRVREEEFRTPMTFRVGKVDLETGDETDVSTLVRILTLQNTP